MFLTAAALSIAASALLQTTPPPPCEGSPYDDFDFWIGTWDVHDKNGDLAGRNVITEEEDGCLIVERWTSATGSTGQSYNYYDLGSESWRQVWVSRGITIDYMGGLDDDGSMVLEGSIAYRNNPGRAAPFRGTWTPHDDGSVTQSFYQYNVETDEWDEWFIGEYRPAAEE